MFKKSALAALFVGALAVGSLSVASQAQAGHDHHCHRGPYGPAPYAAFYAAPHVRSVYHHGYHPRSYGYSTYYGGPSYYGRSGYYGYSHGPGFRLSIGF